ncbi:unnamed protein product [Schistosoma curassoni]|uniref:Reverse transcriptase domain-containing protein n=1 Tax=Schistosoma curassoni TaxID=6186 RepID=A0A183L6R4_9TREM|nr:unnamed protein product [Schistosoma curassoni]
MEDLATTAENSARGNIKQLYDTTKKPTPKYSKTDKPVDDREGKTITEIQEQRNRWVENLEKRLNRPLPSNQPDIEAVTTNHPIPLPTPTIEEVRIVIGQIRSGKAARPVNTQHETLKSHIEVSANMHHVLIRNTWEE